MSRIHPQRRSRRLTPFRTAIARSVLVGGLALLPWVNLRAGSTSANYSIPHASLDASGGRSQSGSYSLDTSMAGWGAPAASTSYRLRTGFAGQLNEAPIARSSQTSAQPATAVTVALTALDPEGDPIVFRIVTPPAQGTLTGDAPSLTYTPGPGFTGSDQFAFVAGDRLSESAPATVTLVGATVSDVRLDLAVDFNQTLALTLTGPPSSCFRIETSTDLETWTSFAIRRTDAAGRFILADPIPPALTVRWFRARSVACDASVPP